MLVHLGGTRILGALATMDGRQGVDLMRLANPKVTPPRPAIRRAAAQRCNPSQDQRGMLKPSGTSSADSW